MKKTAFSHRITLVLILGLACAFPFTAMAQNYYPADIGNAWVLESADGEARTTYTLEAAEVIEDPAEYILLKISTEELSTGDVETDEYFLTVDTEVIKLHSIVLEDDIGTLRATFSTPVTFFPLQLVIGNTWQIAADVEAELRLGGKTLSGTSTTDFEVIAFEDVVTPVGTFQNCAKVQLDLQLSAAGGLLKLNSTTYQWFAPDIGPVQYENSDGLLFSLIRSNLLARPAEPDTPEETPISRPVPETGTMEESTPPKRPPKEETRPEALPYDVTGDGVVNILDLTFAAARFGETDSDADVTGDGTVNILDLVRIAQNLGN